MGLDWSLSELGDHARAHAESGRNRKSQPRIAGTHRHYPELVTIKPEYGQLIVPIRQSDQRIQIEHDCYTLLAVRPVWAARVQMNVCHAQLRDIYLQASREADTNVFRLGNSHGFLRRNDTERSFEIKLLQYSAYAGIHLLAEIDHQIRPGTEMQHRIRKAAPVRHWAIGRLALHHSLASWVLPMGATR